MFSSPATVNIPETLVWRGSPGILKMKNAANITKLSGFVKNFLLRETPAASYPHRLIFLAFFGKFDIDK